MIASYSKTDDGKGQYVLYVNGVNKGGKLISPYVAPRGDNSFYIGCSYFKCVQDATLESIPFHGRVDELQVFPYAFSANQATGYYRSQSVIYDLRLDDPPGAYLYEEADGRPPAACPSDLTGCPLSGVPGRENQAALFDGVDDRLTTSALTDQDVTTVGLTMGAWVYPASASAGVHAVLSTDNGGYDWSIVRNGGKWAVYDGTALWDTGVGVQTNTWQHVAAVFNPTSADKITFYLDGFPSAKSATVSYDASSGPLSIGCLGAANGCFDGSIDEVFVQRKPLAALDIAYGLYLQAPDLAYHLEEGHGATQFRNDGLSAGAAACLDDACPGAGVKGTVGLAAQFDGVDEGIRSGYVFHGTGTLMAWVNLDTTDGERPLFADAQDGSGSLELFVQDGRWKVSADDNVYDTGARAQPGQWQHVALVTDGYPNFGARFYVNGSVAAPNGWQMNATSADLTIGGRAADWDDKTAHLAGRIDEVAIYERALTAPEIQATFAYQSAWVQDTKTTQVIVDTDLPSAGLTASQRVYPNKASTLLLGAADPTSGVVKAEWRVNGGSWQAAEACQNADPGSAWCPVFGPGSGGAYTVDVRATDRAGNTSAVSTQTLYVDGVAPVITSAVPDNALVRLVRAADRASTVKVQFNGDVSDPTIVGSVAGSGVASVRLTLLDPSGAPVGSGARSAAISAGKWSSEFQLTTPVATGPYTLKIEAADNAGNTAARSVPIHLDATGPAVDLVGLLPGGARAIWRLEQPAAPYFDGSGYGNDAVCDRTCPAATPGKHGSGLAFDGVDDSLKAPQPLDFGEEGFTLSAWVAATAAATPRTILAAADPITGAPVVTLRLTADGKLELRVAPAGSAPAMVTTPRAYTDGAWRHVSAERRDDRLLIYVDGEIVASAPAESGALGPLAVVMGHNGGTEPFAGTLDDVSVHYVPLTTAEVRSLAFTDPAGYPASARPSGTLSELPLGADALLDLRLDDTPAATTLLDSSAYGNDVSCAGATCPTATGGQVGPARHFDGVDDLLRVSTSASLTAAADGLTVMAWVRPASLNGGGAVLTRGAAGSVGAYELRAQGSEVVFSLSGVDHSTTGANLTAGQWQHLAATVDATGHLTLYVNGTARTSASGLGSVVANSGDTLIGAEAPGVNQFAGEIDEVAVFPEALSGAAVLAYGHPQNAGLAATGTRVHAHKSRIAAAQRSSPHGNGALSPA